MSNFERLYKDGIPTESIIPTEKYPSYEKQVSDYFIGKDVDPSVLKSVKNILIENCKETEKQIAKNNSRRTIKKSTKRHNKV